MKDILFWIWLCRRVTPGSSTFAKLLAAFDDPYEIYGADEETLRRVLSKDDGDLRALLDKDREDELRILNFCNRKRVIPLAYDDPRFPDALRKIKNPPVMLFCFGTLPSWNEKLCVSVVGTREMSRYGMKMAFEIARDLAVGGAIVVSGMARGIDGVANAASINGGGQTVAVLGSGIDILYPVEHRHLAAFIAKHGVIVTEFPPGTRPLRKNFPIRNRIISGLSTATAVIEGDLKSGALITARLAKQQGRTVYALPGRVDEENSMGPCFLLRDGAKALTCADDILSDFEKDYYGKVSLQRLLETLPPVIEKVLSAMRVPFPPEAGEIKEKTPKRKKEDKEQKAEKVNESGEKKKPLSQATLQKAYALLSDLPPEARTLYELVRRQELVSYDELEYNGLSSADCMAVATQMEFLGLITLTQSGLALQSEDADDIQE